MSDTDNYRDVCQKIAVVDIIYSDVLSLENQELSRKMSCFKAENVQWVLNHIHGKCQELDHALELEESNYLD